MISKGRLQLERLFDEQSVSECGEFYTISAGSYEASRPAYEDECGTHDLDNGYQETLLEAPFGALKERLKQLGITLTYSRQRKENKENTELLIRIPKVQIDRNDMVGALEQIHPGELDPTDRRHNGYGGLFLPETPEQQIVGRLDAITAPSGVRWRITEAGGQPAVSTLVSVRDPAAVLSALQQKLSIRLPRLANGPGRVTIPLEALEGDPAIGARLSVLSTASVRDALQPSTTIVRA